MRTSLLSLLFVSLIPFSSFADGLPPVVLPPKDDVRCLPARVTAAKAHASITDYANYVNLPGASYKVRIGRLQTEYELLVMTSSNPTYQVREIDADSPVRTEASVRVVLQPVNVRRFENCPRFTLKCDSHRNDAGSFEQTCRLDPAKDHYGVDAFFSMLKVRELQTGEADLVCADQERREGLPAGALSTRLSFHLEMTMNSENVQSIKEEALAPFPALVRPFALALFDERSFFTNFYMNFYNGWLKSVSPQ